MKEFTKTAKYKKAVGTSHKTGKPKPGNVSANRFVERMTSLNDSYPHLQIEPPKYGDTISYVIKKAPLVSYDMKGRKVPTKMGDRWEYVESFDNRAYKDMLRAHNTTLEVDTSYYVLHEMMAIMARFTSYDPIYGAYAANIDGAKFAEDYGYDFSEEKDADEKLIKDDDVPEEGDSDYFEKDQAEQRQAKALLTNIYMKNSEVPEEVSKKYKKYYKAARHTMVLTTSADDNMIDVVEMMYDYDGIDAYIQEKEKRCSEKTYSGLSGVVDNIGRVVVVDDAARDISAVGAQYLLYRGRVSRWAREFDSLKNKCVADMKSSYLNTKKVLGEYGKLMDECVVKFRDEDDDADMFEILGLLSDGALDEHVEKFVNAKMLFDGAVDVSYRMAKLKKVAEITSTGQIGLLAKNVMSEDGVADFLGAKKPLKRNVMLDHLKSLFG